MARRKTYPTAAFGSEVGYDFVPPPAANDPPAKLVTILGHSYVRNLFAGRTYDEPPFKFHKLAESGATVESLRDSASWEQLARFRPVLTILIIGGNDISESTSPRDLANAIQSLAQQVEELTHGSVIILTIENRLRPRRISGEKFKTIKNATNRWLRRVLPFTKTRCYPCGVMDEHLGADGVHLTPAGNIALLDNIVQLTKNWRLSQHRQ